eukprot:gene9289-biopygen3405
MHHGERVAGWAAETGGGFVRALTPPGDARHTMRRAPCVATTARGGIEAGQTEPVQLFRSGYVVRDGGMVIRGTRLQEDRMKGSIRKICNNKRIRHDARCGLRGACSRKGFAGAIIAATTISTTTAQRLPTLTHIHHNVNGGRGVA